MENDFLNQITGIIEHNLSDEHFGVSELAEESGMSRSNLLRKVQKTAGISASQFIRQVRLQKAMELLKHSGFNVSEVSFQVGFGSTSYFIKCFREYYGYPPGEVGRGDAGVNEPGGEQHLNRSRQLAAIMFTDIEGYTALMQHDEDMAIQFRSRHREVFNSVTKKYNGRILQYYGDGTLSTFSSAIDAVRCGIEMQLAFQDDPKIPVRIGIHTGDILVTREEIIGDGVNIASRIESLAAPGSVFISEKVYDEVKNQSGITAVSMGLHKLKNVDKSVEVYAIANPGLIVPREEDADEKTIPEKRGRIEPAGMTKRKSILVWAIAVIVIAAAAYLLFLRESPADSMSTLERSTSGKSIAVLPFINDSNDSSNIYIINGLMDAILNNLQQIEDLRVISRTSVERYRNDPRTIPELSRELNVDYFVEGSGQKIGDEILLNIQLIEASTDSHLLSRQYNRKTTEIFKLQLEVAKNITDEIEVYVSPEEAARIEKAPTDNLEAYDLFLKGQEYFLQENLDSLEKAIVYFKEAIELDEKFAYAYANIAIAYYYLDLFQAEKKHTKEMDYYSDKALLLDGQLSQSLTSKALYYLQSGDYEMAVTYLEKALELNPNSAFVLSTLANIYTSYRPNTAKYLEYALKGVRLEISAHDSSDASFVYLHIGNAFIQAGFTDQAEKYINKSLEYDPGNLFSAQVKAYIRYVRDRDFGELRKMLVNILEKDTTRLDVLQETGKVCYFMHDYDSAYYYFNRFIQIKDKLQMDIFRHENAKIGYVLSKMGYQDEAEKYFNDFLVYAENDNSIYRHTNLAIYYAYKGETGKALEEIKKFSEEDNYFYWIILFMKQDPLLENIVDLPEFKRLFNKLEIKFWKNHDRIRESLEDKGLI